MKLEQGRPQDCNGRADKEIRVYDLLDRLYVKYERIDHESVNTMDACEQIDKVLCATICKNLFLCNRQKTSYYLLMIRSDKHFKTKDITDQIGSARLSFADEQSMLELLDITPGSVSVLGLMNDTECRVQLLIDRDVIDGEYFGCHPCINTSSLRIKTQDLIDVILPSIGHDPIYVKV